MERQAKALSIEKFKNFIIRNCHQMSSSTLVHSPHESCSKFKLPGEKFDLRGLIFLYSMMCGFADNVYVSVEQTKNNWEKWNVF